ncbi:Phospholipase A2 A2-actitoxin-Cgg2a [Acropora cervicornis]|uniref:Phospholipase A2 n=1 Tax=Acropora cervicornis TaxID=6130 RepID=A0AAD9V8D6_ACRCE|nr:Phospholipase A2 A2-actitoxin-Cgg2a [Acropora cervicornis]
MQRVTVVLIFVIGCTFSFPSRTVDQETEKRVKTLSSVQANQDSPIVSSSRSLIQFGLMIACHVGRNPLEYVGYGCYCGIGGEGVPKDQTDRCCQQHDQCYNSVIASGVCPLDIAVYLMPYKRKNCYECETASYYWFYGECRETLCKCDSEAVQCFKRSKFNPALILYPQDKC